MTLAEMQQAVEMQKALAEPAPPENDYYAVRLAEVNERIEVVSTEDIVNTQGALVCRKGVRITSDVARRIVQHKLVKPLEDQVQIAKSVSGESLYTRCQSLLTKFPDLKQTDDALQFDAANKALFLECRLHPTLVQKLTVMEERSPHELEKALFCAWLTGLLARELSFDRQTTHAAFLAALLHDVGFLHIDPEILSKKSRLSPPEWRAVQSHGVIGKLLLEHIPGLNPRTARAVLEHHERCDGSGYPTGKNDTQLDLLGQIVGITDSIQSIRIHQFEPKGRNLRDLLPYLQMNATTYFYDVYKATTSIVRKSGLRPTIVKPPVDIATQAEQLLAHGRVLQEAVEVLIQRQVFELLAKVKETPQSVSMHKVATHVLTMSTQSGLVSAELFDWLSQVHASPDETALLELNEIELMQNELLWQLNNAARVLGMYLENSAERGAPECAALESIMAAMKLCLEKLRSP
jgi:HD-GYP domain-containing protein (c-di-GMP phosphodiesterase class II)